jgi:predicted neuraminidase
MAVASLRLFGAAVVVLWVVQPLAQAQTPPVIVERAVVFHYSKSDPYDLSNRYGFNHAPSVTRLSDGRLLAAWFCGPFEASVHQLIMGAYSDDEGRNWSDGVILQDFPRRSDFDPAFVSDGQRTWLFTSVGRWNRYPFVGGREAEKTEVGIDSFRTFVRITNDAGKTWSDPARVGEHTGIGPRSNGIQLSSGELIVPLHNYVEHQPSVLKSTDGGATWRKIEGPKPQERVGAAEPSIAETKSGKLLMVVRSRDGSLWTATSSDKGQTWTELRQTEMPAAATSHSLIRLRDGRLLLTHNPSKPPLRTPLTLRISSDEGESWHEPVELARVEPPSPGDEVYSRQVTYPSAIELPDGAVVVVWTEISVSPSEQYGIIHSARVRFK